MHPHKKKTPLHVPKLEFPKEAEFKATVLVSSPSGVPHDPETEHVGLAKKSPSKRSVLPVSSIERNRNNSPKKRSVVAHPPLPASAPSVRHQQQTRPVDMAKATPLERLAIAQELIKIAFGSDQQHNKSGSDRSKMASSLLSSRSATAPSNRAPLPQKQQEPEQQADCEKNGIRDPDGVSFSQQNEAVEHVAPAEDMKEERVDVAAEKKKPRLPSAMLGLDRMAVCWGVDMPPALAAVERKLPRAGTESAKSARASSAAYSSGGAGVAASVLSSASTSAAPHRLPPPPSSASGGAGGKASGHRPPGLVTALESYLCRELAMRAGESVESQLEVHREVLRVVGETFKDYGPLITGSVAAYDDALAHTRSFRDVAAELRAKHVFETRKLEERVAGLEAELGSARAGQRAAEEMMERTTRERDEAERSSEEARQAWQEQVEQVTDERDMDLSRMLTLIRAVKDADARLVALQQQNARLRQEVEMTSTLRKELKEAAREKEKLVELHKNTVPRLHYDRARADLEQRIARLEEENRDLRRTTAFKEAESDRLARLVRQYSHERSSALEMPLTSTGERMEQPKTPRPDWNGALKVELAKVAPDAEQLGVVTTKGWVGHLISRLKSSLAALRKVDEARPPSPEQQQPLTRRGSRTGSFHEALPVASLRVVPNNNNANSNAPNAAAAAAAAVTTTTTTGRGGGLAATTSILPSLTPTFTAPPGMFVTTTGSSSNSTTSVIAPTYATSLLSHVVLPQGNPLAPGTQNFPPTKKTVLLLPLSRFQVGGVFATPGGGGGTTGGSGTATQGTAADGSKSMNIGNKSFLGAAGPEAMMMMMMDVDVARTVSPGVVGGAVFSEFAAGSHVSEFNMALVSALPPYIKALGCVRVNSELSRKEALDLIWSFWEWRWKSMNHKPGDALPRHSPASLIRAFSKFIVMERCGGDLKAAAELAANLLVLVERNRDLDIRLHVFALTLATLLPERLVFDMMQHVELVRDETRRVMMGATSTSYTMSSSKKEKDSVTSIGASSGVSASSNNLGLEKGRTSPGAAQREVGNTATTTTATSSRPEIIINELPTQAAQRRVRKIVLMKCVGPFLAHKTVQSLEILNLALGRDTTLDAEDLLWPAHHTNSIFLELLVSQALNENVDLYTDLISAVCDAATNVDTEEMSLLGEDLDECIRSCEPRTPETVRQDLKRYPLRRAALRLGGSNPSERVFLDDILQELAWAPITRK